MVVENNKKLVKPKLVNIKKGGGFGNHPGPGRPPKNPKTTTPTTTTTKTIPNNNKWILPPPPIPKMSQITTISNNSSVVEENSVNSTTNNSTKFLQFVGHPCGNHASYSFYKAIKYSKNGQTKILSLGEFFFVKIWPNSDLVAIGELQLLWEDKNTDQTLSSLRLYFLPEYTPEGRMHYHGEVRQKIFYYLFILKILKKESILCITRTLLVKLLQK